MQNEVDQFHTINLMNLIPKTMAVTSCVDNKIAYDVADSSPTQNAP